MGLKRIIAGMSALAVIAGAMPFAGALNAAAVSVSIDDAVVEEQVVGEVESISFNVNSILGKYHIFSGGAYIGHI